jgi:hypothetical protein
LFIADTSQDRGLEPETSTPDGDVCRTSSDRFLKSVDIFESSADLDSVQVDGTSPDTEDVQRVLVQISKKDGARTWAP